MEKENHCEICYLQISEDGIIHCSNCNNDYHSSCFFIAIEVSNKCPMCKHMVDGKYQFTGIREFNPYNSKYLEYEEYDSGGFSGSIILIVFIMIIIVFIGTGSITVPFLGISVLLGLILLYFIFSK